MKIWGIDGWCVGTLQQGAIANSNWTENLVWNIKVDDEERKSKHEHETEHLLNTMNVRRKSRFSFLSTGGQKRYSTASSMMEAEGDDPFGLVEAQLGRII